MFFVVYFRKKAKSLVILSLVFFYEDLPNNFRFNSRETNYILMECINNNISTGRSYLNVNLNVSNCVFRRFSLFQGDGGVVYVKGDFNISIAFSMFFNCTCSNYGGAVYISALNSQLNMICAYMCSAMERQWGQLSSTKNNFMYYLSISFCSYKTIGRCPIGIFHGNQRINYMNSSFNQVYHVSGISISSPSKLECNYCTFSKNNVASNTCISLTASYGTVSRAIIVGNNSPNTFGVVYIYYGTNIIEYSIFDNNINDLFYVEYGSLEILHSFISHNGSISSEISVLTSMNNSFIKTNTYQIDYLGSKYCQNSGQQSITDSNNQKMIWYLFALVFILFLILFFYSFKNRIIAQSIFERNQLMGELQGDFG